MWGVKPPTNSSIRVHDANKHLEKMDDHSLAIKNDINDEMSCMCAKVIEWSIKKLSYNAQARCSNSQCNATTLNGVSQCPMQFHNSQCSFIMSNVVLERPMQYYNAQGRRFQRLQFVWVDLRICAMKWSMGENSTKNHSKPINSIQVQKIIKQVRECK